MQCIMGQFAVHVWNHSRTLIPTLLCAKSRPNGPCHSLPDLVFYFNADPWCSFIIPMDFEKLIAFEQSFCNNAFQKDPRLMSLLFSHEKPSKLFRGWCQL